MFQDVVCLRNQLSPSWPSRFPTWARPRKLPGPSKMRLARRRKKQCRRHNRTHFRFLSNTEYVFPKVEKAMIERVAWHYLLILFILSGLSKLQLGWRRESNVVIGRRDHRTHFRLLANLKSDFSEVEKAIIQNATWERWTKQCCK